MAASDHAYPPEGQRTSSAAELRKPQTVLGKTVGLDELKQHFTTASAYTNWVANLNVRDIKAAQVPELLEMAFCLFRDVHLTANCEVSGELTAAFEKALGRYKVHLDTDPAPEERPKFIPADGAPIETAPAPEDTQPANQSFRRVGMGRGPTITKENKEQAETIFSAEVIEGHTTLSLKRPKLTPPHPVQFENGMRGVVGSPTSGVMVSPAFGRKYGDLRREVMSISDLMGRINTQFQRVAFAVGAYDSTHMEYLTMKIFEKCPDIDHSLVLSCLQVSVLAQYGMSREGLTVLLSEFYELVAIVDPRPQV